MNCALLKVLGMSLGLFSHSARRAFYVVVPGLGYGVFLFGPCVNLVLQDFGINILFSCVLQNHDSEHD